MSDIAIIGGGAAGAAVFGELLNANDEAHIHWVVGGSAPGRGVAYGTTDDFHLLNVRAAGMCVFSEQAGDFLQHAIQTRPVVKGADFLPRGMFGDFIEAQVRARIDVAQMRGRHFDIHDQHARGIRLGEDGRYVVQLADGTSITVDAIVLAVGALRQRPLSAVSAAALSSGAYELDPWRLAERASTPRRVVIIGTGLSAIDSLLSASALWPKAELVAVSRHGQLPLAHPLLPRDPYPYQAELNDDLLACNGVAAMLKRVRETLVEEPSTDWRSIIDGMRSINARLWQGLQVSQRKQFLRHVRWIWEASRHRVAPASHDAIEQLQESGRLQVLAARVLNVDGEGPLAITVRSRGNQLEQRFEVDLAIQATGLDTAVAYASDTLLSSLLDGGLATPDPLQLGLLANADGQLLNRGGVAQQNLYAIGALLRGNLWECTAMPEIRSAAHGLAMNLANRKPKEQAGRSNG